MRIAVVLFLLSAIVYFLPVEMPFKGVLPVLLLSLFAFKSHSAVVAMAFFSSAVGDLLGNCGVLLGQIAAFALAHVCLIVWFIKCAKHIPQRHDMKIIPWIIIVLLMVVAGIVMLVSHVEDLAVKTATIFYAIVLGSMVVSATLCRSVMLTVGALLFMTSDIVLSWTLFVGEINGGAQFVMATYYMAQLLIFVGARNKISAQIVR